MNARFPALSLSLVLCVFAGMPSPPAALGDTKQAETIRQRLDIPYGREERQTLDVFAPREAKNAPVLIFVHGGSWMFGDKNFHGRYRPGYQYLARQGVVTVAINYRLSPRVKHPEHVKDVARAFAWVRAHIAEHGGDRERIILCGHSAGGHLVTLLATADAFWEDKDLGLTAADRQALRGVAALCGVYRIPDPEEFAVMARETLGHRLTDADGQPRLPASLMPLVSRAGEKANVFRLVFGRDAAVCQEASPLTHVRKGLPPFLLLNAERDLPRLTDMAREFEKALQKADVPVDRHEIDGSTHHNILLHMPQADDAVAKHLLQFVDRCAGAPARKKP